MSAVEPKRKSVTLRYRGHRGRAAANGVTAQYASAADLAKALYDGGWKDAEILDMSGEIVGGVRKIDFRNRRTWWGQA